MKKVLHCSLNGPTYSSEGIAQGFRQNDYDVTDFNWQNVRFHVGTEGMLSRLIALSQTDKFDLIFLHIQNPEAFDWETAAELKKTGAFVVNFTEDVRKDISWHFDVAHEVDLTIFTNEDDISRMYEQGFPNVAYLPTSYNDLWYKKAPVKCYGPGCEFGDIIFIGNNFLNTNLDFEKAQERFEMVQYMKQEFGSRFKYYGHSWGAETTILNPMECVKAYNSCTISITHNNFLRTGYTSDRLFNSLGCGAFTISQHFPGVEELFSNSVVAWKTFDDLRELCKMALGNETRRREIAIQNHHLVLDNHRWQHRVATLDHLIQKEKDRQKFNA